MFSKKGQEIKALFFTEKHQNQIQKCILLMKEDLYILKANLANNNAKNKNGSGGRWGGRGGNKTKSRYIGHVSEALKSETLKNEALKNGDLNDI